MGYQIIYEGPIPGHKIQSFPAVRLRALIASAILVFSIAVRLLWPEGTTVLRGIFLPGALSSTEIAFSELMDDIKDGQSLEDSVTVFCRKVINEIPQNTN